MNYTAIVVAVLLTLVGAAAAQVEDAPSPIPVSFTAEPRQPQWRIGFDLGNVVVLEAPELNPENNVATAMREAERVLPRPSLDIGLALLPASNVNFQKDRMVNPRQWTILDLKSKTIRKSFQALAVFMGRRLTSSEGGYHLVSVPAIPVNPFLGLRKEPAPEDLIFAFAGPLKGKLQVHTKFSETKWENLLPVEDPETLPAGYLEAKELLNDHPPDSQERFVFGTSIESVIHGRISKLWLLNYSHPDTSIGTHPWGIFQEETGRLTPLYVFKPSTTDMPYVAYFTASVDLDQDGTDELIVEASYRIGTAYKVISSAGGKYQEIFTSYYRGPAS